MTVLRMCPECHTLVPLEVDEHASPDHVARQAAQQVRAHFAGHGRAA